MKYILPLLLSLAFCLPANAHAQGIAIGTTAGAGLGSGEISRALLLGYSLTGFVQVSGDWEAGVRYGNWRWAKVCFIAERSGPCDGTAHSVTSELSYSIGPSAWRVRPYLGAGGGVLWGHAPDGSKLTVSYFGGAALTIGRFGVDLEGRHQAHGMYSDYDPFTVLSLGIRYRVGDFVP